MREKNFTEAEKVVSCIEDGMNWVYLEEEETWVEAHHYQEQDAETVRINGRRIKADNIEKTSREKPI